MYRRREKSRRTRTQARPPPIKIVLLGRNPRVCDAIHHTSAHAKEFPSLELAIKRFSPLPPLPSPWH